MGIVELTGTELESIRPEWHEIWIEVTHVIKRRATCMRLHAGAVVVKDNRITGTGYNGAPSGMPHCTTAGCEIVNDHCVRTVHAEENAILQAGVAGCNGATLYVTHRPCSICLKRIVNAGIKTIVFDDWYRGNGGQSWRAYASSAGVQVYKKYYSRVDRRYIFAPL